ncbi:hypothetical protein [Natronococcus sp. A-GB7]|uniref:DUF624 domain-containing protein n=1 Tax=Natronococcus sp. A-GB7 TaxID=3037649 RepID=UPI00241E2856|nr:hypothetical protein [Natronococcus sp. A-GB7]MDG5819016.1 hypothetical protein [Natronococcus sp. A-GB7]
MVNEPGQLEIDLAGSVAAFGRIAYSDLLTLAIVSVLATIASLPLVTVGAAIVALVDTVTAVVTGEGRGGPTKERQRIRLFLESFRANLRRGLPYSAVLLGTIVVAGYYVLGAAEGSGLFLIGALLGLYAIVIVLAWLLRTASVAVRSSDEPAFLDAAREGAYIGLEYPWYTALQLVTVGGILLVAFPFPPAYALVVPGLLALLEVVTFEETAGRGAMSLVRAYRGELE